MSYEQKEGQGVLFRNEKGDNQARPDYRGSIKINGVEYELAAWLKQSRDGSKKYMSLAAKVKGERQERPKPAPQPEPDPFNGEDLPF